MYSLIDGPIQLENTDPRNTISYDLVVLIILSCSFTSKDASLTIFWSKLPYLITNLMNITPQKNLSMIKFKFVTSSLNVRAHQYAYETLLIQWTCTEHYLQTRKPSNTLQPHVFRCHTHSQPHNIANFRKNHRKYRPLDWRKYLLLLFYYYYYYYLLKMNSFVTKRLNYRSSYQHEVMTNKYYTTTILQSE